MEYEKKILEIINLIQVSRNRTLVSSLNKNIHLRNDIGFDSLDLAEFTVRIEEEYNIDIFEDSVVNTVEEVILKLQK
mgnify:CR=1 FL=1